MPLYSIPSFVCLFVCFSNHAFTLLLLLHSRMAIDTLLLVLILCASAVFSYHRTTKDLNQGKYLEVVSVQWTGTYRMAENCDKPTPEFKKTRAYIPHPALPRANLHQTTE